ncbi:basic amino acid ABC transporter substrate-binding protein [soil metagenome]
MKVTRRPPLLAVALAAVLILSTAACGSTEGDTGSGDGGGGGSGGKITTIEPGELTVGSDIPYPPFEYRKGGKLVGLDIDLITAVAKRLKLDLPTDNIIDTNFNTIFGQLAGARFDVVAAASTITPDREKEVDFTIPYYNSQQSLTVEKGSDIETIDDLSSGDTVGVQNGTTGKDYAEKKLPSSVEVRSFPQGPDGYTALEAGQLDAVINDEPTAIAEIAERSGLEIAQRIDTGEVYGFAVDPNNDPLRMAIDKELKKMIADGTYQKIYDRYAQLPPGGSVGKK